MSFYQGKVGLLLYCTLDGYCSRVRGSTSSPHVVGASHTPDVSRYCTRPGAPHSSPVSGYFRAGSSLGPCVSLTDKAKAKVSNEQLKDTAREVSAYWQDFALELDPTLFQMKRNISAIQFDQNFNSPLIKAQCMLETWRDHYDQDATCTRLINALCRAELKAVATMVFGQELVEFVCSQSQSE